MAKKKTTAKTKGAGTPKTKASKTKAARSVAKRGTKETASLKKEAAASNSKRVKKTAKAPAASAKTSSAGAAPAKRAAASRSEENSPETTSRPRHRSKILPRNFLTELAEAIRDAVAPAIREAKGREVVGTASSGDATFELDKLAEKALLTFLKTARLPVAYYSEDSGYSTFTSGQPQNLLIVDPIDGTRAAKSGFEGCVVSVATTRVIERPSMADVDNALVMEILGDRTFYAERGKGTRIVQAGHKRRPKRSENTNLELISWSMTVPARPAELIFQTAARLIDLSSLKGGFFACNSTSFSLTRLITNQLDACVDVANRFYRDIPDLVKDHFINAGRGQVIGVAPYDIAASVLIAQEAGCVVTDAYGKSFDDVLLLDSTVDNHRSVIAASTPELHKKLLSYFDTRVGQLEQLLKRHAAQASA